MPAKALLPLSAILADVTADYADANPPTGYTC